MVQSSKLALTYSPPYGVPSAMEGLTAVFGMETGGPPPLKHQLRTFNLYTIISCVVVLSNTTAGRDGGI